MAALITAAEVKTLALLNPSLDVNLIKDSMITNAQKTHLIYFITENLYNAMVITPASYANLLSGVTYTNTQGYAAVFEGCKKFIAFATMFDILPIIYMQVGSVGLVKNSVQYATSVNQTEMEALRGWYHTQMQNEGELIEQYLKDQVALYPLYTGSVEDYMIDDTISSKKRLLNGMIF